MNTVETIVFVSLEYWDDIWRRNQFMCAELARRHPESRILFITPPRDLSNALRRGNVARFAPVPAWSPEHLPNVVVSTPTKWLPSSLVIGRAVNARGLRRHISAEMRRLGIVEPLLWINDHAAVSLVGRLGERGVIYDITDDWTSFSQSDALRTRIVAQDAALCSRADAVIVCSERLREMKAPLVDSGKLFLIPNGVDVTHYRDVCHRSGPIPAEAEAWERPVLGYTGTIHSDRVDVTLIEGVARSLAAGSIALVGPNHLSVDVQQRLKETRRVHFVGPVSYARIPQYMRAFDVCIVPHRVTPFTESLNPIKLWEYLASGKPIVSTPVAGFRDFPKFVVLAEGYRSFLTACERCVNASTSPVPQQREAANHSWASRVDEVERVLAAASVAMA